MSAPPAVERRHADVEGVDRSWRSHRRARSSTPPFVDLTMKIPRLPVVGQKPKTSPKALVLTSQPIAVPVVSAPLTWIGVPQGPPARCGGS